MKLATLLLGWLCALAITASAIWASVSFIIYLVKDLPFDWRSLWAIGIFSIATPILITLFAFLSVKSDRKKMKNNINNYRSASTGKKSAFQQRLEEIENNRNKQ